MKFLLTRLPKDLVYIIYDYAQDRTNHDKIPKELETRVWRAIQETYRMYPHSLSNRDRSEVINITINSKRRDLSFYRCIKWLDYSYVMDWLRQ